MAVSTYKSRSLGAALRYRGREGMWTWILHRVTGLGILFFLILHVVDTALVIYWPGLYDHALAIYQHPLFRLGEFAIFFSVLFHALNGLRIIVQDFWPGAMLHQRRLTWAVAALTGLALVPIAWIMLGPILGLREEPGTARHQARMRGADAASYRGPAPQAPPIVPPLREEGAP
jgi:succinate dehydrogenase / fumarate reductase cytochrome b subunit